MKLLVNLIQLAIIAAIILPILSIVDNDKVEKFCQKVQVGMSKQAYLELVEQEYVKLGELTGADVQNGKWKAVVIPRLPLTDSNCLTEGAGNIVATTERVDTTVE